jgi:hypothetical protein
VSNRIVAALENVVEKLGKSAGKDGAEAVEKLYRITGKNTEDVVERCGKVDAEHQEEILKILRKMDENAGKEATSGVERATVDKERANLRKQLADILGDKKESKDALKDFNRADKDIKYEKESAGLKEKGTGATALGQNSQGQIVKMKAKNDDRVDVSGLSKDEQVAKLKEATVKLGDDAKADDKLSGNDQPGCSCGFLRNGEVSVHTSMKAGVKGQNPTTHPALQNVLDDMKKTTNPKDLGIGHGNCGEVATISDEVWRMDPEGTKIKSLDDLKAALKNSDGSNSAIYSTRIGDTKEGALMHGDYLPPCNSCNPMLKLLGVDAVK